MGDPNLYSNLKMAYTEKNLNTITSKIIELYRNKHFDIIKKLALKIKDFIEFDISKTNRLFNQMIMLYHPDKLNYYRNILDNQSTTHNQHNLFQISHILIIQGALEKKSVPYNFDYTQLYNSQIQYGIDDDDLDDMVFSDYINDIKENESDGTSGKDYYDFIRAVQDKEGISYNVNSSSFILEQFDGALDMSGSGIYDLKGIEYCINLISLDLSENHIIDIFDIRKLKALEAIYLSNNYISDITALSDTINLKYIDLSFNDITDIEPLLTLNHLEYLNIIGNKVPLKQIKTFQQRNILIIF